MTKQQQMTKQQRKSLAAKVAKAREAGKSGDEIRVEHGSWLTGPERRKLLREFGHDGVIKPSYDRATAKAAREAAAA
jgi:hypothetical protein